MTAIVPTIGRVIWYYNTADQIEPWPALINKVWGADLINVAGFTDQGVPFAVTSVTLIQDATDTRAYSRVARWMPYQQSQQAKTNAETKSPVEVVQDLGVPTVTPKGSLSKYDATRNYGEFVHTLVKPGYAILETLTPEKVDAWHAATGVVGEAGELIDAVKKFVVYNKPSDRANVVEELGDLEFYMEQIRQNFGISREECITENVEKLYKRYPQATYTDAHAQARLDKV